MKPFRGSAALALALFLATCGTVSPVWAQNTTGKVIATCGTVSPPFNAGNPGPFTVDVNGNLCTAASGGGGGAVTIADGADVAEGATANAAYTGSGSATVVSILKGIYNAVTGSIPAGTAIIGKIGIDQTTPGTTNGVQINAALPAGTNVIGHVIADTGSTTAVTGTVTVSGSVTANAGTNLNTSLLALETGGNLASVVTQLGAVTASPTANTVNDRLKTINTTLGTPFQAGGSIANTSFAATQGTAANLNATVVGTGTFAVQSQPTPVTSGGVSLYTVQPAASDNHVVIKAGAGQVYKIEAFNNSATINYLRLYNATTGFNGCNSATNLVGSWIIPASTSGAGLSSSYELGIAFATGISICITSGYGNTDTTNATASALLVNVGYK